MHPGDRGHIGPKIPVSVCELHELRTALLDHTTGAFLMCEICVAEYVDPANRRNRPNRFAARFTNHFGYDRDALQEFKRRDWYRAGLPQRRHVSELPASWRGPEGSGEQRVQVLTHSLAPSNAGGLSLGQVVIAAARLEREQES